MTFSSLAQLKQRSWATMEEAVKELKRNSFKPRGADYELRATESGSIQIMPLENVEDMLPSNHGDEAEPAKPAKGKAANVKAAKTTESDEEKIAAAVANAASFAISFRISPKKVENATAKTMDEAIVVAMRMNAEHGKHGRRAGIYAVPKGKGASIPVPYDHEAKAAPEADKPKAAKLNVATPHATDPEPRNDLSAVPADGGPYTFRIPIKPQFDLAQIAERWAVAIDHIVEIIDPKGKVVRTIDPRMAAKAVKPRAAASEGATRQPRETGKSAEVAKLLFRTKGATKAEIVALTEWSFGERYIRRIAATQKAEMETLAKDHWRLVKTA